VVVHVGIMCFAHSGQSWRMNVSMAVSIEVSLRPQLLPLYAS